MTNIEAQRRVRRWSQSTLGFHSGLTQGKISTFERGHAVPSERQAERLSRILGVPPDALLHEVRAPGESAPAVTEDGARG